MKVFISSVISGFEEFRDTAAAAISALDHEPKRAEDYGASPDSPQQVCLAGVRAANVVVLLLGARYGYAQRSGLSATHEEYVEARREGKDILVVIQCGVSPEPAQQALIREVQGWVDGQYTDEFSDSDTLRTVVTRGLHRLEQAQAAGTADPQEMRSRARALLPDERSQQAMALYVIVAGSPKRQLLDPGRLESEELERRLTELAKDTRFRIFDFRGETRSTFRHDVLHIDQPSLPASLILDELGTVLIKQPTFTRSGNSLAGGFDFMVLIEEEIHERTERALRLAAQVFHELDPLYRLSDVVVLAAVAGGSMRAWRTRAEHIGHRNQVSGSMSTQHQLVAELNPLSRRRASLTKEPQLLARELTVRLGREVKS